MVLRAADTGAPAQASTRPNSRAPTVVMALTSSSRSATVANRPLSERPLTSMSPLPSAVFMTRLLLSWKSCTYTRGMCVGEPDHMLSTHPGRIRARSRPAQFRVCSRPPLARCTQLEARQKASACGRVGVCKNVRERGCGVGRVATFLWLPGRRTTHACCCERVQRV